MIEYRLEVGLRCNGCFAFFPRTLHTQNIDLLPQLGVDLSDFAVTEGWTKQGPAIWCPQCVEQRGKPGEGGGVSQGDRRGGAGQTVAEDGAAPRLDVETGCTEVEMKGCGR